MSSNHRVKRQFAGASADPAQRQITSFFSSRGAAAVGGHGDEAASLTPDAQDAGQPSLPASVQANLLSVGMRIRKSVPEGYKTCGPSAFKLWTDPSTGPAVSQRSTPAPRASSRELVPFCGINKVGGLATQAFPRDEFSREGVDGEDGNDDDDDDDEIPDRAAVPELSLSQMSVESSGAPEPSRKRVYAENELHEAPTMLTGSSRGWDDEVSPRSFAPSEWRASRVMAVPRARAKKSGWIKGMGGCGDSVGGQDFEDASFLDFGDETVEMDTL